MSNYNGRHGPNVSNYLRDLNTISPQEGSVDENFNMEGDLALFTNTEFFDFETGQNTDFQAQPVKETTRATPASSDDVSAATSVMGDMPNLDFISSTFLFSFYSLHPVIVCRFKPHQSPFPASLCANLVPAPLPGHSGALATTVSATATKVDSQTSIHSALPLYAHISLAPRLASVPLAQYPRLLANCDIADSTRHCWKQPAV